jgi:hypothetical protein
LSCGHSKKCAHLKYLGTFYVWMKKLMSRDQNALTTSLPLNYSFMLKCCRSPIILLMKTHCNGMHAAYKLICTHTLIQFTGRFYLHIFTVWPQYLSRNVALLFHNIIWYLAVLIVFIELQTNYIVNFNYINLFLL